MLEFRVLGPLVALRDGEPVQLTRPLERRLAAILVARRRAPVSDDALSDILWGGEPPANATSALQSSISRLRKILGDRGFVQRTPGGYQLGQATVDADQFEEQVKAAESADHLEQALSLWSGSESFSEFRYDDFATAEAVRLDELRLDTLERLFELRVEEGRGHSVVADLEVLAKEHPLRERVHELLMLALYRLGRQADALRAFQALRQSLAEELGIEPSPSAAELEERILLQDPTLAPTATPSKPNNIPSRFSSLVGRDGEIDEVVALLGTHRMVTLTGPGGVGKTSISIEVARQIANRRETWFIDLTSAAGPRLATFVVTRLARLLQQNIPDLDAAPFSKLLGRRNALIVLDNCEHVIDHAAELARDLLEQCPDVSILATSRERLRLTGENVHVVSPLSVSSDRERPAALQLFLERVADVADDFVEDTESIAIADRIVRRLDGLPLALELAASQAQVLALEDIDRHLSERIDLTMTQRGTAARHQSLEAAIGWSYDRLDPKDQRHLQLLAVVQGPFSIADAACLCELQDDRPAVMRVLGMLREKSLIQADTTARPTTRFEMLATIREYGRAKAEEAGLTEKHGLLHATCFLALARRAKPHLDEGPLQLNFFNRVATSLPDMRMAIETFQETGEHGAALELAAAIGFFFEPFRRHREGLDLIESVIVSGREAGWPSNARAHLIAADLWLLDGSDDFAPGRAHIDEAVRVAEADGDAYTSAEARAFAATYDWFEGNLDSAVTNAVAARPDAEAAGAGAAVRMTWMIEGIAAHVRGDHERALPALREAVRLSEEASDAVVGAYALSALGAVLRDAGLYEESGEVYERGFLLARRYGFPMLTTVCAGGAALGRFMAGDTERALVAAILGISLAEQRPSDEGYLSYTLLYMDSEPTFAVGEIEESMRRIISADTAARPLLGLDLLLELLERRAERLELADRLDEIRIARERLRKAQ